MRVHSHLKLLSDFFRRNRWQCLSNHVEGWHYFIFREPLALLHNRRHLVLNTNVLHFLFCACGPAFRRVLFSVCITDGQQEIVVQQQLLDLRLSFRQQGSEFLALLIDLLSNLLNLLDFLLTFLIVYSPLRQLDHLIQAVLSHLAVGLVLHHQIRNFNLSICISERELRCKGIRNRGDGHVPVWHI